MKKLSLITVGDKADFDSFKKLHRLRKNLSNPYLHYCTISYEDLLDGKLPKVETKILLFFLFFPFGYWNRNIESKHYSGIYGNISFYKKFIDFFKRVDASIKKGFPNKKIFFVNRPFLSAKYRDKLIVKRLLDRHNISTPRLYRFKEVGDIYRALSSGRSFYIKLRYGSMGKGVTFISPLDWKTNFLFRKNKILSRKSDYGWRFRNITGKELFLKKLIKNNVYIEEAIDSFYIKGRKFDLRVYVFFGKVLYIYPKSNAPENITTNISQEGEGEYPAFLRQIPKTVINRVKKIALRTTETLGLNFAGVDLLIDRGLKEVFVIDVNLFPGFPNQKIFNLAKHLTRDIKKRAIFRYL